MYNVTEVKYKLGKCRRQSWPKEKYYAGSVMDGLRQTRRNIRRNPPKFEPGTAQIQVRSVNLWSNFAYCQFSIWSTFIGKKRNFQLQAAGFHFCDLSYTPQWPHYAKWLEWFLLPKLFSSLISSHAYKTQYFSALLVRVLLGFIFLSRLIFQNRERIIHSTIWT